MDAVTTRLHPWPQPFHSPSHHQPRLHHTRSREGRVGCFSSFAITSRALMKIRVTYGNIPENTIVSGIAETKTMSTSDFDTRILLWA